MIDHIQQPNQSSVCGQSCVGMYLGISLQDSIVLFGGSIGGTRTTDLCRVLTSRNIKIAIPRLQTIRRGKEIPHTCILKICWKTPEGRTTFKSHWILKVGDTAHDPGLEVEIGWGYYSGIFIPRRYGKITSYLELPAIS